MSIVPAALDKTHTNSYGAKMNAWAIAQAAEIIRRLYAQSLPEGVKTTYNVGVIEGGSTVNSIAERCRMLYEYRSEDDTCLTYMKQQLEEILQECRKEGIRAECTILGIRPGLGDLDPAAQEALEQEVLEALCPYQGMKITMSAGSTDANIPLSLGIPAVTLGSIVGEGAHTRQEWVDLRSIPSGIGTILRLFDRYLV